MGWVRFLGQDRRRADPSSQYSGFGIRDSQKEQAHGTNAVPWLPGKGKSEHRPEAVATCLCLLPCGEREEQAHGTNAVPWLPGKGESGGRPGGVSLPAYVCCHVGKGKNRPTAQTPCRGYREKGKAGAGLEACRYLPMSVAMWGKGRTGPRHKRRAVATGKKGKRGQAGGLSLLGYNR